MTSAVTPSGINWFAVACMACIVAIATVLAFTELTGGWRVLYAIPWVVGYVVWEVSGDALNEAFNRIPIIGVPRRAVLERTAHHKHFSMLRVGWLFVELVLKLALLVALGALIYGLYKLGVLLIG
jgi:hypothetical protein